MNIQRKIIHEKLHMLLLGCIVFTLPYAIKLNSILIIICCVNWLLEGGFRDKLRRTFTDRINLCWILLYFFHIASVWVSTNETEALGVLERRLSFLVFPLLLCRPISSLQLKLLLNVFVVSVFTALLVCYVGAWQRYIEVSKSTVFFYHNLASALLMNAVYLSAYVVFSINILIKHYFADRTSIRGTTFFLLAFFFISVLMFSSKIMLFILFINLTVWAFYFIKNKWKLVAVIFGIFTVITSTIYLSPNTKARFMVEFESDPDVIHQKKYTPHTPFTGTSLRWAIWRFSMEIMYEEDAWLTGVGSGDVQALLDKKYLASGMYSGNVALHDRGYLGYGPHNEYIEILFALGIPGLIIFLLAMSLQFYNAITNRNILYLQLCILATIFFLTESALGGNKGIVFLMIFFIALKSPQNNLKNS